VGLPGSWAVLFLRAKVVHPAGCSLPRLLLLREDRCCLQEKQLLGIRNGHRFRGRCPSARTLARLRIAGRVAAPVARLTTVGAVTPLPDGFRTRWTTYRIS